MKKSKINSKEFYFLLKQGYTPILKFINDYISNMRSEFVNSVKNGFFGYCNDYGSGVLVPVTINEFFNYVHNYIINNENFYSSILILESTIDEMALNEIYLRGTSNQIGNELYDGIIKSNIDSDCIDIINLDKKLLIMTRDLGRAAVIEIDVSDVERILVKYFIPINKNVEKTSKLKGINENNERFATGIFQTT